MSSSSSNVDQVNVNLTEENDNHPLVSTSRSSSTTNSAVPILQSPSTVDRLSKGDYGVMETPVPNNRNNTISQQEPTTPPANQEGDDDHAGNLLHGINSFWAVVTPVAITMILASFVVVHYRSAAIQQSMGSYLVFDETTTVSDGVTTTSSTSVGKSLLNALVIIGFVAVLTFAMVCLYKFNCMKFLVGYIMFASAGILGFEGGQLMDTVLNDNFQWPVDWITFLYVMYNFGVVGVISVFYQKGTPKILQNGYLVMVSVILAWQFSMWPEWTTWIFCNMFAVYDLCAVLTPCGPLKCLIGLIQEKQQPMPGLLYEANVRDGVTNRRSEGAATTSAANVPPQAMEAPPVDVASTTSVTDNDTTYPEAVPTLEEFKALLVEFYERTSPEDAHKATAAAERFFPNQSRMWPLLFHKYKTCSCYTANRPCVAKLEAQAYAARLAAEEEEDKTIKLGLGDFIFYSVLVGRAALFDITTMFQCFLCILLGLGATLFMLSVLHKALPALPFSIFLATAFYFWTRYTLIDFVDFLHESSVAYV